MTDYQAHPTTSIATSLPLKNGGCIKNIQKYKYKVKLGIRRLGIFLKPFSPGILVIIRYNKSK
jgi:hypothetical protein